jgi:predicted GIY-YIG superfamily endonuclease
MSERRGFELAFYAYMLLCSDDSVYVGHTDDLQTHLSAHRQRRFSGYTAKRLPVTLIFYEEFATRDEAFRAERRIKGWSYAKKRALARRQWDRVVEFAAIRSSDRERLS